MKTLVKSALLLLLAMSLTGCVAVDAYKNTKDLLEQDSSFWMEHPDYKILIEKYGLYEPSTHHPFHIKTASISQKVNTEYLKDDEAIVYLKGYETYKKCCSRQSVALTDSLYEFGSNRASMLNKRDAIAIKLYKKEISIGDAATAFTSLELSYRESLANTKKEEKQRKKDRKAMEAPKNQKCEYINNTVQCRNY